MKPRFSKVVGIGGIGAGLLFLSDQNATLGRSESRLVALSDAKDYCKLHIVFHYVAALLRPKVSVYPIGCVGNDAHGGKLLEAIRQVGMDTTCITVADTLPTMLSICLQYPDKETCNFTTSNSACDLVTPAYTRKYMDAIGIDSDTLVAAIPEVRVESRVEMLRYARKKGAFAVLSIPESEAGIFKRMEIFSCCDLLSVNEQEALALAPGGGGGLATTKQLYLYLKQFDPAIMLVVTCGSKGAFTAYNERIEFVPCLAANVVNTTGAGDAFLGGLMAGLSMGLDFQKGRDEAVLGETPLSSAAELGALCAGMAVESADSIALSVNWENIFKRMERQTFSGRLDQLTDIGSYFK